MIEDQFCQIKDLIEQLKYYKTNFNEESLKKLQKQIEIKEQKNCYLKNSCEELEKKLFSSEKNFEFKIENIQL